MEVIKKVLANVVQTLTRAEQATAKKNIGLGDSVHQPPVDPYTFHAGSLVWDPDHTGVYRLLEDWSYTVPWTDITKKVRVMPTPEYDPLRIDISDDELNTNKPGIWQLVMAILSFGKPYIRLMMSNGSEVRFEYVEHRILASSQSYVFRTWRPESGDPPTFLMFEQITVTVRNNINYSGFKVNL